MTDNQDKSRTQTYVTAVPVSTPVVITGTTPVDVQTAAQLAISDNMIKTYNYRRKCNVVFRNRYIFFSYLLFISTLFSYSVDDSIYRILWR